MGNQGKYSRRFAEQVLMKIDKPIEALAFRLKIPPKTLWNWKNAIYPYGIDLLSALYLATEDMRIWDFFLRPCGLIAIESNENPRECMTGDLIEKVAVRFGRLIEEYRHKDPDSYYEATEIIRLIKGWQERMARKI